MFQKKGTSYWHYLLLVLILSCTPVQSNAQDSTTIEKCIPQLRLIDSIKVFVSDDLGLHMPSTFYTGWSRRDADSMNTYFYISPGDRVEKDTVNKIPWFLTKNRSPLQRAKKCRQGDIMPWYIRQQACLTHF
jgi:hypothetical protein